MRVAELKQKNNSRSVVVPRQIAMYLAKQMTEASLPEIGRQFGGKHHTTVMNSIGKIDEQKRTDKKLNPAASTPVLSPSPRFPMSGHLRGIEDRYPAHRQPRNGEDGFPAFVRQ